MLWLADEIEKVARESSLRAPCEQRGRWPTTKGGFVMARRGDGIYLRGKTWWLDFTHRRQRHVLRLGKNINRTAASELARVQRAAVLKAEAGIGGRAKGNDPLFDDAAKEFMAWVQIKRKARTAHDYGQILEHLKAPFGGRRLGQIDELSIERYKRSRIGAPAAANRELAVRKSLYHRCRDDLRIYDGPTPRIKLWRVNGGRLRFLDVKEEAALLRVAAEPLRTILLVGLHTGLRIRSEALQLQTADVDLARGLLTPSRVREVRQEPHRAAQQHHPSSTRPDHREAP